MSFNSYQNASDVYSKVSDLTKFSLERRDTKVLYIDALEGKDAFAKEVKTDDTLVVLISKVAIMSQKNPTSL
ncbi:unnamed protein product [Rhizopus stolonifer]